MSRLIDADALMVSENECQQTEDCRTCRMYIRGCEDFAAVIAEAPTVEPERKTGRWIDGHCSNCGCDIPAYIIDWKWQKDMDAKFCPECGSYNGGGNEKNNN